MSVRVMALVWAMDLPDSDKIVLLALADCANDEGHCWPGMKSLTAKCSKTDRTIQTSIKRLVDAGHLTRREVPGKGCNYTVHPRSHFTPEATSPPKGTTETPEAASGKPSRTSNSEAKASSDRVVANWNEMARKFGLPECRVQDASLRQKIRCRVKENGEAVVLECIAAVGRSPWLRGEGRDGKWRPNLGWLMEPRNFGKTLEGAYGAEQEARQLTPEEKIRFREDQAAFYRRIGRDAEADQALAVAARLRAAQADEANRRLIGDVGARSIGEVLAPGGLH